MLAAAVPASADRRPFVLALMGNLICSWSNNESLFTYVLMSLPRTDEAPAAVVFATLNTTRTRLDLIQRLAVVDIARYGDASNACMSLARMRRHSDQAGIRNKARCRQSEELTSRAPPRFDGGC